MMAFPKWSYREVPSNEEQPNTSQWHEPVNKTGLFIDAEDRSETLSVRPWNTILIVLNIVQMTTIIFLLFQRTGQKCSLMIYSPANNIVEYRTQTFTSGYQDEKSIYQSKGRVPTNQTDAAWTALYKDLLYSRIPQSEAAKLPDRTVPIPNDRGYYVAGLDVFHQLHCLDNIRKAQWPEKYKPEDNIGGVGSLLNQKHLDHCIDQLRQSVTCAADVSTIFLRWSEKAGKHVAVHSNMHTCRNFEKIQDWARQHVGRVKWDDKTRVKDPLDKP